MLNISDKQEGMLAFIKDFLAQNGYPPTYEEIRAGLNISTKSLVNYHLEALENAALLSRVPNTPRGIRLSEQESLSTAESALPPEAFELEPTPAANLLDFLSEVVANNSQLTGFRVEAQSGPDEPVQSGDFIILQPHQPVQNGEIVALKLLEQDQTVLRRYYRENGHVRLEPAQTAGETMIVSPDRLQIKGKVVAIVRQMSSPQ